MSRETGLWEVGKQAEKGSEVSWNMADSEKGKENTGKHRKNTGKQKKCLHLCRLYGKLLTLQK